MKMKTTLNLMLGSLILVSVAGHGADHNQVRAGEVKDLPTAQIPLSAEFLPGGRFLRGDQILSGDQFSPKSKLKPTNQPTKTNQRSIGETEKNLIARPPW
ncbi:MAG: hypothetical protein ACI9UU_003967 [Candidatus Azotimanducaceae bacterium]|jgi:hypothetical protein